MELPMPELRQPCFAKYCYINGVCVEFLQRKIRRDNTSGMTGVRQNNSGKWRATTGFKGKRYNLGAFDTLELAQQARRNAEKELFEPILKKYELLQAKSDLKEDAS